MPREHKNLPRLFVSEALADDHNIILDQKQTHYLAHVLRKSVGDQIVLFNGQDGAWTGEIEEIKKKSLSLCLRDQVSTQPEPHDFWLGFAPIRSGRIEYLVQKATEMGASQIQPVKTEFTQNLKFKPERLEANIIEAAEQCEVLQVPKLLEMESLSNLVNSWRETHGERILFFADEAMDSERSHQAILACKGRSIGLIVGPEGGFSAAERRHLLEKDFVVPISLGPRILRADTAVVAGMALIQSIIGDWR